MVAEKNTAALRKRAQISKAGKLMFIWVAVASIIVSGSVAVLIVVAQKGLHNARALAELNATVKTLQENNAAIPSLEDSIRALGSDQALLGLKAYESDNALQVILDALPADQNASALGASLQAKLLTEKVELLTLEVEPTGALTEEAPVDSATVATTPDDQAAAAPTSVGTINFTLSVSGSAADLKELLDRFEASIRTIQITSLTIVSDGGKLVLTASGQAYYQASEQLQLEKKGVQP